MDPINPDLQSIPGVGPAAAKLLREAGVHTTYQLIGQFLILRKEGIKPQELCDAFYQYIKVLHT